MVIRRVGVMSVGKLYGVMCAALGLIFGLLFAAIGSLGAGIASQSGSSVMPFAGFGIAAVFIIPIVYGAMGFIGGLISAALYNVFAGIVGGIEVHTEDVITK